MPGTITKRGENTYRLTVSLGSDVRGKHIRRTKTVHCTEAQAKKELAKFYAECGKSTIAGSNFALAAFCEKWLAEYAKPKLKSATLRGYSVILRNNIIPLIGHNKMSKLKPVNIQEWVNILRDESLSPKTIKNSFSLLHKIYDTAITWGVTENNPCIGVELPRQNKTEAKYYNNEQVALLIEKLETLPQSELRYKAGTLLALFTGIRLGELMGLKWEDVDFDNQTISIKRTRYYSSDIGTYIDTPKTEKSLRTVSAPIECIELLQELKKQQQENALLLLNKWEDSGFVITNDYGAPLYPTQVSLWFSKFIKRNNLDHISFHGLRHTHTSLLYHLDVNIVQISKRLGHSQISTTQNIYTHLFNDTDKEISDKMSNYLKK